MGFPQLRQAGATLRSSARASHCGGLSCCGVRAPGTRASAAVACGLSSRGSRAVERRLNTCGTRAQLIRGMWDPPGPGLEPTSPALAGRLPATAPPGKSQLSPFIGLFFPHSGSNQGSCLAFNCCHKGCFIFKKKFIGV